MPHQPLTPDYATVRPRKPWSGAAIAAGIFGIPSPLFPPIVVIAIPCAIIALRATRRDDYRGRGLAIVALSISGAVTVLAGAAYWLIRGEYQWHQKRRCAQDMKVIGEALIEYADTHGNRLPPDLDTVLKSGTVGKQWDNGHRSSYVYVGRNLVLSAASAPELVLMYEPMENHGGDGIYVLFADGHTDFIAAKVLPGMLNSLKAGQNPPSWSATQPSAQ